MRASLLAAVSLAVTAAGCGGASHLITHATTGSQTGPGGPDTTTTSTRAQTPGGSGGQTGHGGLPGSPNTFQGSVASATGAYAGEGGRAAISVRAHGSGGRRPVRLVFHSLPCQGAPQCVQLDGTLMGEIAARRAGPPDTGRSFSVTASGRLTTLGTVTATGIVQGTGFIARGHEVLDLTLVSRAGRITMHSASGTVHGFTSP